MQDGKQTMQVMFIEEPYVKSQETNNVANNKCRICQIDGHSFYPFTSRTWIGDSGASCFITNDPSGIIQQNP